MSITAQTYFNSLKSYLNLNHYGEVQSSANEILLKEKVFQQQGTKPKEYRVTLKTTGEVLVIKLDVKKNGSTPPLFHFLDDTAKPWSKRCDYVVFNQRGQQIHAYCFEFKSESIPPDVPDQLEASVSWCKALHATLNAYTAKKKTLNVKKFVFSDHPNPAVYLDEEGKYLKRDHSIRHYLYSEVSGMTLDELENTNIEVIR